MKTIKLLLLTSLVFVATKFEGGTGHVATFKLFIFKLQ